MNKLFVTVLIGLALAGCTSTPQDKSEKAIQAFLKANLKNPKTYKSIGFSKVDTVSQWQLFEEQMLSLSAWRNDLIKKRDSESDLESVMTIEEIENFLEGTDSVQTRPNRIDSLEEVIENIKAIMQVDPQKTKSQIAEYRLFHDYSSKSPDGKIVEVHIDFVLDNEFKVKAEKLAKDINGQAY